MSVKRPTFNSEHLWFTSDLHIAHKNIIAFSKRPYKDIREMREALFANWNEVVGEDDDVFILGDFAWTGNIEKIAWFLSQLKGRKHLIYGNHDVQNRFDREVVSNLFASAGHYLEIEVEDEDMESPQMIVLSHYPFLTWNGKLRGSWQLFGHIHSGPLSIASERNLPLSNGQYDVGVDNNNYYPISYNDIKIKFTRKYLGNE
jgi:calcineurin-like phosphoesterase family protein